jgi:hypothetical protein
MCKGTPIKILLQLLRAFTPSQRAIHSRIDEGLKTDDPTSEVAYTYRIVT